MQPDLCVPQTFVCVVYFLIGAIGGIATFFDRPVRLAGDISDREQM